MFSKYGFSQWLAYNIWLIANPLLSGCTADNDGDDQSFLGIVMCILSSFIF